jgi:hypothetical protein
LEAGIKFHELPDGRLHVTEPVMEDAAPDTVAVHVTCGYVPELAIEGLGEQDTLVVVE